MLRLDYVFDASEGTITFTDTVVADNIEAIINATDGIIIYNSVSPGLTGTLVGKVLTLTYDTASMSDSDVLQIFYGDTVITSGGYTFESLIAKVNVLVDDASLFASLGDFINQGVFEIAGGGVPSAYFKPQPVKIELFQIYLNPPIKVGYYEPTNTIFICRGGM